MPDVDLFLVALEANAGDRLGIETQTHDFGRPLEVVDDPEVTVWRNPFGPWLTVSLEVDSTYRNAPNPRRLEIVEGLGAVLEGYGAVYDLENLDRDGDQDDVQDDPDDDLPDVQVDVETAIDEADHIVDVADRLKVPITDAREIVEARDRRLDVAWTLRHAPERDDEETVSHIDQDGVDA